MLGFMPYFCGTCPPQAFQVGAAGHSSQPPTAHARPARPLPCWTMITGQILAGRCSEKMACWSCCASWSLIFQTSKKMCCLGYGWRSAHDPHFLAKEASAWMSVALVFPCISVAMAKYRLSGQHPLWHPVSHNLPKSDNIDYISPLKKQARKPQTTKEQGHLGWKPLWMTNEPLPDPLEGGFEHSDVILPTARLVTSVNWHHPTKSKKIHGNTPNQHWMDATSAPGRLWNGLFQRHLPGIGMDSPGEIGRIFHGC